MKGCVAAIFLMIVGLWVGVTAGDAIDADSALGEVWSPALAGLYGGTLCFLIGCLLFVATRTSGRLSLRGAVVAAGVYLLIGTRFSLLVGPRVLLIWPVVLAFVLTGGATRR